MLIPKGFLGLNFGDLFRFNNHKRIYSLYNLKINPSRTSPSNGFLFEYKCIKSGKSFYSSDLKKEIILIRKKLV
jgi:hypothetical protein